MDDTTKFTVKLWNISGLGPARAQKLLNTVTEPSALFQGETLTPWALEQIEKLIKGRVDNAQMQEGFKADMTWLQASKHHHILVKSNPLYPPMLKESHHAPEALYVIGHPRTLSEPQIAIVGARQATEHGLVQAEVFGRGLAEAGLLITSGLARGIDAAAHKGALHAQQPTIAVLAHGLRYLYPSEHKALAKEIIQGGGALVSEYPVCIGPKPHHFPRRNRIIAGLSKGVLVIEAAIKSGSLISARYAVDEGRDVFAIPGPIDATLKEGCHALIKVGAKLVENISDVLNELHT